MKKLIILSTILLTIVSCKVKEKPEFLRVENIKVLESTANSVTLTADAFFMNPNDIGGELKSDGIKVFVNDNKYKTLGFTYTYEVDKTEDVKIKL